MKHSSWLRRAPLAAIAAALAITASAAASTTKPAPLIWPAHQVQTTLLSALDISASDSSGSGGYDFRVGVIRQLRPVNVYSGGRIYRQAAFIVVADLLPINGNFQYGTLSSFCFRPLTHVPHRWKITGFDTLQTAISGRPPYGCRTTPDALRAAGYLVR